jgi:L-amino acid N-acyltransferase YncA
MARNLLIREADPDDAEAVIRILNPIIEAGIYTVLDTLLTVEVEREFITTFPRRGVFHVAECESTHRLVALQNVEPFATYTRAHGHVGVMGTYVHLAERRQGIGKRLSRATFQAAQLKGYEKIFTFVRADNPGALTFYLKLGFRIAGNARRHVKLDGRYVDEIIIEKFL